MECEEETGILWKRLNIFAQFFRHMEDGQISPKYHLSFRMEWFSMNLSDL